MAEPHHRRGLGKLVTLGWLLLHHGGELEADFAQFYGVELVGCSPRRAYVLATNLPREARVTRKMSDAAEWGNAEHLLATLIDALQVNTWVLASANSEKGKAPKKPTPVKRPGEADRDKSVPTGGRALARLLG